MPRTRMVCRREQGFSLTEVLIVVAIGTVIAATALPSITNVIANAKMRASLTSVSGLLQNTRMLAVKQNRTMTARHFNRTTAPFSLVYYVKQAADSSSLATADSQIEMEAPIAPYPTPTGAGAPSAIDPSVLGFTPQTGDPSFNSRGLPCAYSGGNCATMIGFITYYKDNRVAGAGGWSAISISPAGRIKRWFWNGSAWTD